jgi:hypothetical protein
MSYREHRHSRSWPATLPVFAVSPGFGWLPYAGLSGCWGAPSWHSADSINGLQANTSPCLRAAWHWPRNRTNAVEPGHIHAPNLQLSCHERYHAARSGLLLMPIVAANCTAGMFRGAHHLCGKRRRNDRRWAVLLGNARGIRAEPVAAAGPRGIRSLANVMGSTIRKGVRSAAHRRVARTLQLPRTSQEAPRCRRGAFAAGGAGIGGVPMTRCSGFCCEDIEICPPGACI